MIDPIEWFCGKKSTIKFLVCVPTRRLCCPIPSAATCTGMVRCIFAVLTLVAAIMPVIGGVKIGGQPSRIDVIVFDFGSDGLLTEFRDVTVLDTGLVIEASVCDLPSAESRLAATFGALKEVRGRLSITKGTCFNDLSFLTNLSVVRADMVEADTPGITLVGFAAADLPASLMVRPHQFTPLPLLAVQRVLG